MTNSDLRLGVNIDHVATVRNARGGSHPDPVRAALAAEAAGADGITAHLREDRRHIRDADIFALKEVIGLPLNFEMAATDEMVSIACEVMPNAACIVPERREEVTTEGGLAVAGREAELAAVLAHQGIRYPAFAVHRGERGGNLAAAAVGADIVEPTPADTVMTKARARLSSHVSWPRRNWLTPSGSNVMPVTVLIMKPWRRSRPFRRCGN